MNKQQAIQHDLSVHDFREEIRKHMLLTERIYVALGGESDANALAVTIADDLELWEDEDMPYWLMETAEQVVEQVVAEWKSPAVRVLFSKVEGE